MPVLYYYHDPMCSWCWGYRPVADQLFSSLPAWITRVNVLGGLAPAAYARQLAKKPATVATGL
jgi:putative protein-disulfide isomerase